jgi:hypothetical protein
MAEFKTLTADFYYLNYFDDVKVAAKIVWGLIYKKICGCIVDNRGKTVSHQF